MCDVNMCLPSKNLGGATVKIFPSVYKSDGTFLQRVLESSKKVAKPSMLLSQFTITGHVMSVHRLAYEFVKMKDVTIEYENFVAFVKHAFANADREQITANTTEQSECSLWFVLRWCRITASRLNLAANAGAEERETLMKKCHGAGKFLPTEAMKRGLRIEADVCKVVEKKLRCRLRPGPLVLDEKNPLFAASPDAIGKDFIVEVKSPMKNENKSTYLRQDNVPAKKVLLQMLLQMRVCNKPRGFLVLADENFETNGIVEMVEVRYSDHLQLLEDSMTQAEIFYKYHIFRKLMDMLRSVWL
jgi:hypothetical protein